MRISKPAIKQTLDTFLEMVLFPATKQYMLEVHAIYLQTNVLH